MKKNSISMIWCKKAVIALVVAGASSAGYAQNAFSTPDNSFKGQVMIGERTPIYSGVQVPVTGQNFKPGQQVLLERGQTSLNTTPYVVGEDGTFKGVIDIPKEASVGIHPIVVKVAEPDAAIVVDMKISPMIGLAGADKYNVLISKPGAGLYQTAYSAKNNAVFVTSAVGRPPVKEAGLFRLNADTLAVEASVVPAQADERSGLWAPYGVGVDDKHATVWVTNTRQGSVAVYKQDDLSLIKQFDAGILPGGRDVVVDEKTGRAYISSPSGSNIYVFDTEKLELASKIDIQSTLRRETFKSMSLSFDEQGQKLYTVSLSTPEIAVIDTKSNTVLNVFALPGLKSGSGIAIDAKNARAYVVGQGIDGVMIVDINTGKVLHTVLTGANSLNVAFNAIDGLAYVTNRSAGTLTAVDGSGKVVANLDIGPNINHVTVDSKGRVFVTNKAQADNDRSDQVTRLAAK